jgi:hypothetical protein
MTQLVNLAEIKDFLSIKTINTDEDGRLSNIAVQVSSLVTSYCGREFGANNYTEYFDGGSASVFVANPPINSVYEVSHYDGIEQYVLGGPDTNGQPIVKEGSSHSITSVGIPVLKTRVKQFGRSSLRLDGESYLIASSNEDWDLGVDDFTIELFARFDETSARQTLVSSTNTSNSWSLSVRNNNISFVLNESSTEVFNITSSNTTIELNKFYHVGISRESDTFRLFLNGNIVAQSSSSVFIPNYGTGVLIGKYTTGYLDSVRISHSAIYTSNYDFPVFPLPPTGDTKLLMRFDGPNNSTTFSDLSRVVNEYSFYPITGEVTFDTGDGGGKPELGFFRPLKFRNFPRGVKVVYNGGFTEIPEDLKLATLEMVKVIYKGRSGSVKNSLQGDSTQSHKLSIDDFPPEVRRVLNLYRLLG